MASPTKFYERITGDCLKDFQYLSRGAFGEIYRARHRDWGIDVAVKILNRDASCTREELLNEARAMDEARFTYILRLFGLFVDEVETDAKVAGLGDAAPRLGLVMEFMENGSLSTLRDRVPSVPWALRLRILHQVALGMNFLHSLSPPLLHLDLKPSNVLLDGELHVRVADFGLSKFKRGTTQRTGLSSGEGDGYGGTLEFMPPEAFSHRDIYYGILTWSLSTGEEPYPHCSHETEEIYSCYKQQIVAAVRLVQDILMQMDSSPPRGTRLDSSLTSEESTSNSLKRKSVRSLASQSIGLEDHFETMHLQESPSIQNTASPTGSGLKTSQASKSSPLFHRSSSMTPMRGEEGPGDETPGSRVNMRSQHRPSEGKPRPLSDMYPYRTFPPYHPGVFPFQQECIEGLCAPELSEEVWYPEDMQCVFLGAQGLFLNSPTQGTSADLTLLRPGST
ncbi:PREDICTED: probable serine/threonine-protein kinase WNK10 [Gekko japonicus]|uniref:Probable serine/threonine-protein kinase WNK10 n=1 Tax=Gekko japonicus TaxID=146911 RepID=A0ABM1K3B5_GEKJA|nr:PREDICTED: probable serine/threonine-protein kinase WNK10 [Gekko japonicus]